MEISLKGFSSRASLFEKSVSDEIGRYFWGFDYELIRLFKALKKKKAYKKEKAIKFMDTAVWLEDFREGIYGIRVRNTNCDDCNFLFIVTSCDEEEIEFSCYQYFSDWFDGILNYETEHYINDVELYLLNTNHVEGNEVVTRPNFQFFKDHLEAILNEEENFAFKKLFSMKRVEGDKVNESEIPEYLLRVKHGDHITLVDCPNFFANFVNINLACLYAMDGVEGIH